MAEKLCTLRTKGGGGGAKQTETVLWTNPSPTSDFGQTTVTLSDSISNYDYIAVKWKVSTSLSTTSTTMVPVGDFKSMLNQNGDNALFIASVNQNGWARTVFYVSDTSITISTSYRLNAQGNSGSNAIPTSIIGIKNIGGIRTNEKYDTLPFQSVNGGAIPVFSTKGTAKAIWLTYAFTSSQYRALQITNVNPYTGEIDNNSLYRIDTSSVGTYSQVSNNAFVVTNGSVTLTNDLSSTALKMSLVYTY